TLSDRRPKSTARVRVREVDSGTVRQREDLVATEEPLEIRVAWPGASPRSLVVTMRTPGADFDLAVGFLVSEGLLTHPDGVVQVRYCTDPGVEQTYNVVTVDLTGPLRGPVAARYGAASAACGICGKQSLDE